MPQNKNAGQDIFEKYSRGFVVRDGLLCDESPVQAVTPIYHQTKNQRTRNLQDLSAAGTHCQQDIINGLALYRDNKQCSV
jgi:hypothetical protein